jgi:hypothetical protein
VFLKVELTKKKNSISVFIPSSTTRIFISILITQIYLFILLQFRPYASPYDNFFAGLAQYFIIMNAGLSYLYLTDATIDSYTLDSGLFALLLLPFCFAIPLTVLEMFRHHQQEMKQRENQPEEEEAVIEVV